MRCGIEFDRAESAIKVITTALILSHQRLTDTQLCEILRKQEASSQRGGLLGMLASDARESFTSREYSRPGSKTEAPGPSIHVCEGAYESVYMGSLPGVPQHLQGT